MATPSMPISPEATFDRSALAGKSVIITGGASGIGEASMRAFVAAGAFVTFGDIVIDLAVALVKELGSEKVAFVPCNVTVWTDQVKLFKTALEMSPSKTIDIVFANAGLAKHDDLYHQKDGQDGDPVEPDLTTLNVNVIGVAYTAKLAMFYFPKQPEGEGRDRCFLVTSSISGYIDHPENPQYNTSKWGVRGLMRSLRSTGARQGMRANLIAPWVTATRIMTDEQKAAALAYGVVFAEIEDIASAVLHLASDRTINGRALANVPRDMHPRGYIDLKKDDAEDDLLKELLKYAPIPPKP
ncbi:uncharacterized protein MYCGRDRAFT_76101 [Zymoseptoria tritici IPO323]|uniref:Uncharacterized protein n=1 Tax=Zymoseptoria tritici (strain CBS 115943 / IPO323) TaxID=336722 RepID=F9XL97_ZYMTI|nr:uncharacterized protein MYCGRDRAFT_76101 [Zymoseptoria tritici IPO323]EGP83767.1 hypothetical protein MYCGRDRAFT_76101 [Zymoseptoria tritici IPO323]